MRRLRTQLGRFGVATTALFALSVAVPRAALVHHSHGGGDRAHVHSDDAAAAELLAELYEHHHHQHGAGDADEHRHFPVAAATHRHRAASDSPARPALRGDDGPSAGHWHRQDRFQRALAAVAPSIADASPACCLRHAVPALIARSAARDLRVRGPPASPHI